MQAISFAMDTPIITLTTDWGDRGFFAGMVKGALYSRIKGVRVVDIDLGIDALNTLQATFIVRHACPTFPEGTIHIIDVASTPTAEHPFVVIRAGGQHYICCDNGLPAAALGTSIDEAYELQLPEGGFYNFAAYDVFVPVASAIASGTPIHELGPLRSKLTPMFQPTYSCKDQGNTYSINVHYIDSYGNIYLGITYDEFRQICNKRPFSLQIRDKHFKEIRSTYEPKPKDPNANPKDDKEEERYLCLTVSATGLLEVGLCGKSFINLVGGIKIGENVLLTFKDVQ